MEGGSVNEKRSELGWDKHPVPESRILRWVSWPIERAAAHTGWMDRGFTDHDPAKRRSMIRSVIIRAVFCVAAWVSFVFEVGEDYWWVIVGRGLVFGLALASAIGYPVWRAQLYRHGWWFGRNAMRKSYVEAAERGMTPYDWWQRELERDLRDY
jgi:hypothetical protein